MASGNKDIIMDPKRLLQVSFDAIQDGISIMDADLNILRVNRVMEELYSKAVPLAGKKCHQAYQGVNEPCPFCPALKALENGEPAVEEVPLVREGHRVGWLEVFAHPIIGESGQPVGVVEFIRDITSRRKAEEALRERESLFRATLNSIGDAVIATDRDALVRQINPVAEKLCGWEASEACGRPLADIFRIINEHTREPVQNPVERVLREGVVVGLANHTLLIAKDGREIPIADSAAPIKSETGAVCGVVLVFRDVSEEVAHYRLIEEGEQRAACQRSALSLLSVDPSIAAGCLEHASGVLLETAAKAMRTERSSIWLFSEDEEELRCIGLYEASTGKHSAGAILKAKDYPRYFEAIRKKSRIYVPDAVNDPETSELAEPYFKPLGISSLLDAGVFLEGKFVGVVSFEQVGEPRTWHPDDESFASTIASLFGQVLAQQRRNLAEKTLEEDRAQLVSIFDSIDEAVYIADTETYELLYVNRRLQQMLPTGAVGQACFRVLQGREEPCNFCTNDIIKDLDGEPYRWEHHNQALDRTYFVTDRVIRWPDGRNVRFEFAVDITDRKKMEEVLEENSEWYRTLAEDIPALVHRLSPGMHFTYANDAYCRFYGLKLADILGQDLFSFVPDESRPRVKKALLSLTPENSTQTHEHININAEGEQRWIRWTNRALFDGDNRLKEYLCVGEDISERKKAEEELRDSEERSRALVNAMPDMIFLYSSDGRYLDVKVKDDTQLTEKGRELYRADQLIGSPVTAVLSPDIAGVILAGIERTLQTGELQLVEYSYFVKAEQIYLEARMVPAGKDRVMSIVRDITGKRQVETALAYQFQFERLVADISAAFVGADEKSIDRAINYALQQSGEFFGADRSYICRFSEDGLYMDNTHEWCAPGIASMKERNKGFPLESTPWWAGRLKNQEYVYVPDVDELPPEADRDKIDFQAEGTKSFLSIPLVNEGKTIGLFGFKTVRGRKEFPGHQLAMLKVVAEIIAGAMVKQEAETALKESEKRYRDILESMEEAYYEADLAGDIIFFNEAGLKLFGGYSEDEARGSSYKVIYKNPGEAFRAFNRVFMTGEPDKGLVLEMIRKDGSIFYGEISISLLRDSRGFVKGFKGIGRDVTERIEHQKRLEYMSMHDQLTGIYNRTYFEAELARHDCGREYPVTIVSADLDGLKLVNDTIGHDAGDRLLMACARVLRSSLRGSDVLARVGGDEFSAILLRTGRKTGEEVARRIRDRVTEYNQENEELPLGISIGVATAEKEGVSLRELFKRADNLMYRDKLYSSSSSRGRIVQSLLAALAERDYITEGHARRLEDLCRLVGEKIELPSHQLSDLALLAQVHDLGKVGIPDTILFKPGPLNEEEWDIMRGHPEKGYRIASSSPDLAGVADLILKHHERWDGKGYPLGLKGADIPVECRILAIVDAFDAMTNQRPYNSTKTPGEAIGEIESNAGSQFDPNLVPVFVSVLQGHPDYTGKTA